MKNILLRIVFTCSIILLLFNLCIAQKSFVAGVKAGIDIPNLSAGSSSNPIANGWSSRLGPYFGITGEYKFNNRWGIQAELNYSSQGGKKNGQQAIPVSYFTTTPPPGTPKYVYANFNSETKLNYIELPIMARFTLPLGNNWQFFAQAGPYIGYLVAAKTSVKGSSPIYGNEAETQVLFPAVTINQTQDVKGDIKKFNAGIQGGAGLTYKTGPGFIMLTLGGNYGLIPIQKDKANGSNVTGAANATLGYIFAL